MNKLDKTRLAGEIELIKSIALMGRVLEAWMDFRSTHPDLESSDIACCERSRALFKALQELEDAALGPEEGTIH